MYVLKGAHVEKRNNFNPLVTVHFNTPVTSARLVPHGKDLWFVVDLRASVQPSVTMDAAKDGGAVLRIGFPSGSYLPLQKIAPPPAPTPPPAASGGPRTGAWARAAAVASFAVAFFFATSEALAQQQQQQAPAETAPPPIPVAFGADEVSFDVRDRALVVTGHVHVDEPPFHLTSDRLQLRRVPIGVVLDGQGRLAFCPCLGEPLAVRFDGATVAPPHDVILRDPVLEVFGVPVAWAPAFWLRSAGRVGVLPPDVAWRGGDGLFLGEGVHVPWVNGDTQRGLDLRAGAYVSGGVAVDGDLRTATSDTHVKWDRFHTDDGVGLDAHGATSVVAWDVDALRRQRAVVATTDVEAAARPYDRAEANAAWRGDGWTFASGARTAALRGGDLLDLGVGGPIATARRSGALPRRQASARTTWELEGGAVSGEAASGTTTFARAEGGTLLASRLGPVGATLALRGMGDLADDGFLSGLDAAGQARATLSLPFARGYASADPNDPWVHETEPRLEAAGLGTHASDVLILPAGRGMVVPDGGAWVAAAGWRNAVGRWGTRDAVELDASGGAVGDSLATMARPAGARERIGPLGRHERRLRPHPGDRARRRERRRRLRRAHARRARHEPPPRRARGRA